jgi:hypothetical protein
LLDECRELASHSSNEKIHRIDAIDNSKLSRLKDMYAPYNSLLPYSLSMIDWGLASRIEEGLLILFHHPGFVRLDILNGSVWGISAIAVVVAVDHMQRVITSLDD